MSEEKSISNALAMGDWSFTDQRGSLSPERIPEALRGRVKEQGDKVKVVGVEFGSGEFVVSNAVELTFESCIFHPETEATFARCTFVNCKFIEGISEVQFLGGSFEGTTLPTTVPASNVVNVTGLRRKSPLIQVDQKLGKILSATFLAVGMLAWSGTLFVVGNSRMAEADKRMKEVEAATTELEQLAARYNESVVALESRTRELPSEDSIRSQIEARYSQIESEYAALLQDIPASERLEALDASITALERQLELAKREGQVAGVVAMPPWLQNYQTILVMTKNDQGRCKPEWIALADDEVVANEWNHVGNNNEASLLNAPTVWKYLKDNGYTGVQEVSVVDNDYGNGDASCMLMHVW